MIFKSLFKPKFQHPDPAIRIKSISDLDPLSPGDKQKLHELAFNDDQPSVSLAALEKLNSFVLWLKMSQIAVDKRVSKTAEKKVVDILGNPNSPLVSELERRSTVMGSSNSALIKFGLDNPDLCGLEVTDIVTLLTRFGDESYQRQIMLRTESSALQLQLMKQIDDLSILQKLLKKPLHSEVFDWLQGRVKELQTLSQRPVELQRDITLLLSKLKALADNNDYERIVAEKAMLEAQIAPLNAELANLEPDKSDVNQSKFEDIRKRLIFVIEQLKPAYEEQQWKTQQEQQVTVWLQTAESAMEAANKAAQQAFSQVEKPELHEHVERMRNLIEQSEQLSSIRDNAVKIKLKAAQDTLSMLSQMPELIVLLSQVYSTIENFTSTFSLPESYQDYDHARQVFNSAEKQVNALLKQSQEQLPKVVLQPWFDIKREWNGKLSSLKKQAEQQAKVTDKKLNTVNAMIKQGRFKAAFAVYAKLKNSYDALPASLQAKLEKTYTSVHHQIAELEDWQQYIAQPRKPETLAEVLALADIDNDIDIAKRAQDVARLRKTWLSFGQLQTPEDNEMNLQFEQAIERAFSPCRHHFAQQQIEREANAKSAAALLDELTGCAGIEDDSMFLKQYSGVLKKWNSLGQIERNQWQGLKQQYVDINGSLKQRQASIQKANASAKQKIVEKVEQIASSLVPESADTVKQLQAQWKRIGFAGKSKDNQLWAAFKQANDKVFDEVRAGRAQVKQQAKEVFNTMLNKIDSIKAELEQVQSLENMSQIKGGLDAFQKELIESTQKASLERSQLDRLERAYNDITTRLDELQKRFEQSRTKQKVAEVFDYLRSRIGESDLLNDDAPKLLTSSLKEKDNGQLSRLAVTVRLELLVGAESSKQDSELRKQIQLEVMANKMQTGDIDSVKSLFSDWLSIGPIQSDEKELLSRFENAYKQGLSDNPVKG